MSDDREVPVMTRVGRPPNARIQGPATGPKLSAREEAEADGEFAATTTASEGRLVRRRRRVEDKFFIDQRKVPKGWSYEWKRVSVYGQPDTDHQVNLRENAWTPVPASRHPEMMPIGLEGAIAKEGMVLMERPSYLTEEARQEDYEFAMSEVHRKESQLGNTPAGTFPRNHPSVERIARIKRSFGPIDAGS